MNDPLAAVRRLVIAGRYTEAYPMVAPLVQAAVDPAEASGMEREAAYLALRSLPDDHEDADREQLERWLLACARTVTTAEASTDQVLHAIGLSALSAGRANRALHSFATALRGGRLGDGARTRVAALAANALMALGRPAAAKAFALRELARAPHEKLGWLLVRHAALSSSALGQAEAAIQHARRCLDDPYFPAVLRSELEPLVEVPR